MQTFISKNRWVILLSMISVGCCTSFPSLWSIFQADAAAMYGITLEESAMLFPMCTAFFGIFSIIGGKLQDKFPPNIVAMVGAVMTSTGVLMLSILGEGTSVTKLYLCFSLPFGGGCGIMSPAMSASIMKWYADKKGQAMGICAAVTSLILVLLTYISKYLLGLWGMKKTVMTYGIIFMAVGLCSCSVLINPTAEYIAEKTSVALAMQAGAKKGSHTTVKMVDFTPSEMLKTKQFYLLFIAGLCSTPVYMLIAPIIVTLGISRGLSENLAVSAVALSTGISAIGKFIIPTISDKIGRKKCAIFFTVCTLIFSIWLMSASGIMLLVVYSAMVFTYSGWAMLITPFVTDMFGNANAGANVGVVCLYSTLSALASPILVSLFTPVFGSNANHIIGIVGVAIAVAALFMMDTDTSKLKQPQ